MYIFTEERREEGQCSPFSEYEIIWSITHLKTLLCVTIHCTSSCQRRFYQDGYLQNYIVFSVLRSISVTCQRQLQSLNIKLRLFLASEEERPFVQIDSCGNSQCVINVYLISESRIARVMASKGICCVF